MRKSADYKSHLLLTCVSLMLKKSHYLEGSILPYALAFVSATSIIGGCKDYRPEMERAIAERDSVITINATKDSSISSFIESMNEIEYNLDSITRTQVAIAKESSNGTEQSQEVKDRINFNIQVIGELLQRNTLIIESLNKKLSGNDLTIASLRKKINQLTEENALKDQEILALKDESTALKTQIDGLNRSVDSMYVETQQRDIIIKQKNDQLNTAFFVLGTYKELNSKKVMKKDGGFLGIGKDKVLESDLNPDAFTRVDITKLNSIPINSKTAKVITNHPADSYKLNTDIKGNVKSLDITNSTKFWKSSKYLVIVTG